MAAHAWYKFKFLILLRDFATISVRDHFFVRFVSKTIDIGETLHINSVFDMISFFHSAFVRWKRGHACFTLHTSNLFISIVIVIIIIKYLSYTQNSYRLYDVWFVVVVSRLIDWIPTHMISIIGERILCVLPSGKNWTLTLTRTHA